MKSIKTVDAVGHILCHDITEIVVGKSKGTRFKKGHIVQQNDVETLLDLGKVNLFVWESKEGFLHENEAAEILANICVRNDKNFTLTDVSEGKINIIANIDGVLKVDADKLYELNAIGDIAIASRHSNYPIKKGDKIAGTRAVPLLIDEEKLNRAKNVTKKPVMTIMPYKKMKVGIIVTGSEVFSGRIEDKFAPVLKKKLADFGAVVVKKIIVSDKIDDIVTAGKSMLDDNVDMILCSGGMSVDPDDLTPKAISTISTEVVQYGSPVLPGTMIMLGYNNDTPIVGLPGCVMYEKRTVFDLLLPRLITGEKLTKKDIDVLGYGGLCLDCDVCSFPNCNFGKA